MVTCSQTLNLDPHCVSSSLKEVESSVNPKVVKQLSCSMEAQRGGCPTGSAVPWDGLSVLSDLALRGSREGTCSRCVEVFRVLSRHLEDYFLEGRAVASFFTHRSPWVLSVWKVLKTLLKEEAEHLGMGRDLKWGQPVHANPGSEFFQQWP